MFNKLFVAVLLPVFIAGCSMMPKLETPKPDIAASWPSGEAYKLDYTEGKASDIAWEDYFKSENLKKLINIALENNRDLRIASLNIEKAAAAYRIQKTDLLPTVNAGVSGARTATPEDLTASGRAVTTSVYRANLGVTAYELDFFGRLRSLNQKALEAYLATQEANASVRIAIIAETANAYCAYLAQKQLLAIADETYQAQKNTYEVIKKRYELGSGSQIEATQAFAQVETAHASIIQYTRLAAQAKNALTLLVGRSVDDMIDNGDTVDSISFMNDLPAGIPSEVLTSRPDVMAAEHKLKAANADIGAARAALYPNISLTGSFGFASESLTSLFSAGSAYAWNFSPSATIPIFNRGRLKANLEVAKVNEKIAAAEYEKAMQTAFKEVADQLAARGTYRDELVTQQSLVDANKKTFELATMRYDNGISSYLTVLDAQRSLFAVQQRAVTVKQQYLSNLVTLYKVLGGGKI